MFDFARWVSGRISGFCRNCMEHQTFEHDVLVIGAGGAGLRAAIEASGKGVSVGLVCKSLLGKAHTVMAEGGMAAALANVDDRDGWETHFADTMRGGQYLNNWRMAELHAKEAPDRVRELEAWGAVFDRTKDGRILQRNFGGHKYPRLAHVGDRIDQQLKHQRRPAAVARIVQQDVTAGFAQTHGSSAMPPRGCDGKGPCCRTPLARLCSRAWPIPRSASPSCR